MPVDTKRLRYFIQIAQSGSLSKAAKELHIAQPALSRQIHMLEDYLGFSLFVRTGRGMQLTKEGSYLNEAITGPWRDIELALENMRSFMSRETTFEFGIGIHSGLCQNLVAHLVQQLEMFAPDTRLRILEDSSINLIDNLKKGAIDFAVLDKAPRDREIDFRDLGSEELVIIGWNKANLFANAELGVCDLRDIPIIIGCQKDTEREIVDNAAQQAKVPLSIVFETNSKELVLDLLIRKQHFALLSESTSKRLCAANNNLTYQRFSPSLQINTYLATRGYGNIAGSLIAKIDKAIDNTVRGHLASYKTT